VPQPLWRGRCERRAAPSSASQCALQVWPLLVAPQGAFLRQQPKRTSSMWDIPETVAARRESVRELDAPSEPWALALRADYISSGRLPSCPKPDMVGPEASLPAQGMWTATCTGPAAAAFRLFLQTRDHHGLSNLRPDELR
jgi:hypothetical protein